MGLLGDRVHVFSSLPDHLRIFSILKMFLREAVLYLG